MSDNDSATFPHVSGENSGLPTDLNSSNLQGDFNALDAVRLFNSKLDAALEKQRVSIVSEIQDKLKFNNSSSSDLKSEGNRIQYKFNEERLCRLDFIAQKLVLGDLDEALKIIDSEKQKLQYRLKILRIADKHGWDTVKEYTDSDLADNAEDATKLRSAISRAAAKKRQAQTPYSRFQPRNPGVFTGMSNKQLFLGNSGLYDRQFFEARHNPSVRKPATSSTGASYTCFYCQLPGHIAKLYPYTNQLQEPSTATTAEIPAGSKPIQDHK